MFRDVQTCWVKNILCILPFLLVVVACQSQSKQKASGKVGGPCEGCEAALEYGSRELNAVDTLPKFEETEPKLKLTGIVYEADGKTPAEDVILYIYHTNREGIYEKKGGEEGWARRHGHIRGWIKTGKDGHYTFYTFRPASYPNRNEPEHIHITVKEPDKNAYYIDDFLFDDDPLLTPDKREKLKGRGGLGVFLPELKGGILTIERDIVLGKNIPNYD